MRDISRALLYYLDRTTALLPLSLSLCRHIRYINRPDNLLTETFQVDYAVNFHLLSSVWQACPSGCQSALHWSTGDIISTLQKCVDLLSFVR